MKPAFTHALLHAVRVVNEADPILLATSYRVPQIASSQNSCLPLYEEALACELVLNGTFANMSAQDIVMTKTCTGANTGKFKEFCDAEVTKLLTLEAAWQNQSARCQLIPQPCSGAARGRCDVASGQCMCKPSWRGVQCDVQPSAVFWDVEARAFSSRGCELVGIHSGNGSAVTACRHLAEFGTMSKVITHPDAFFSSTLELQEHPFHPTLPSSSTQTQ